MFLRHLSSVPKRTELSHQSLARGNLFNLSLYRGNVRHVGFESAGAKILPKQKKEKTDGEREPREYNKNKYFNTENKEKKRIIRKKPIKLEKNEEEIEAPKPEKAPKKATQTLEQYLEQITPEVRKKVRKAKKDVKAEEDSERLEEEVDPEEAEQPLGFTKPEEVVLTDSILEELKGMAPIKVEEVTEILKEANAAGIIVIDTRTKCSWVDYMIMVTGTSRRHMKAIGRAAVEKFKYRAKYEDSRVNSHLEGEESEDWMSVDLGSVIVHIFSEEGRLERRLEALWALKHDDELSDDVHPDEYNEEA
eukprot:TRINITY_DN7061_c0_g1_i1.p1 TRINITY_DN7061_c0_g1~~TRINITY_DN7061_c0_g1_i1.p1  ORF type:complete len:306 (-),score=102.20 TRINITY_DN7061_c0_g1_i1:210-1127(-)